MVLPNHIHRCSDLEVNGRKWVPLKSENQISGRVLVCSSSRTNVWEFTLNRGTGEIQYRVIYGYSGSLINEDRIREASVENVLGGRFYVLTNTCVFA